MQQPQKFSGNFTSLTAWMIDLLNLFELTGQWALGLWGCYFRGPQFIPQQGVQQTESPFELIWGRIQSGITSHNPWVSLISSFTISLRLGSLSLFSMIDTPLWTQRSCSHLSNQSLLFIPVKLRWSVVSQWLHAQIVASTMSKSAAARRCNKAD